MMFWLIRIPEDGTWYCGKIGDAHAWSMSHDRAKRYPTYMRAVLAQLSLDRDYAGVGFYTTAIIDAADVP